MSQLLTEAERTSILDALSSSDEEVRRLAVEQLFLLPTEEALERFFECLGDADWRVRKAAVERLITRGWDPPIQEMLIGSLQDGENPGRRNSAFEALVGSGSSSTQRLIVEISSADVDVRKLVVDALAAIGDPTSRDALCGAMQDGDPNVRAAAAEALGVVGGAAEVERLMSVAMADGEDVLVRLSALRALARLGASIGVGDLADALGHSLLRAAAFELLGHSTDPAALDALFKGLSTGGRSSREKAMAALLRQHAGLDDRDAEALQARIREEARSSETLIPATCDQLEDADLAGQMVLIQFLGLMRDARVVLPILMAGRDEAIEELADATLVALGDLIPGTLGDAWSELSSGEKARACTLLGKVGGERADRILVDTLTSLDGALRCRAACALAEGGYFDRILDLARCLESAAQSEDADGHDEVATIVGAIVHLAEQAKASDSAVDVQLIEVLSSRLGGASEPVRLAIAQVLARIGRIQDEDVIGYLLKDESSAVRRAAVLALGRFGFAHARDSIRLALADESSAVRIAAAKVLGESGCLEAIEELNGLVVDEDARVVAVAIRAVGRLYRGGEAATEAIYRVIGEALAADPIVALAGVDALTEVGGPRAGTLVRLALQRPEPDVVRAAVACLNSHGDQEGLAEATSLIAHPDWSVRAEAAQVLSARGFRQSLPAMLRRLEVEDDPFVRQVMLRSIGRLEE
jgi:HEAT repeat protein